MEMIFMHSMISPLRNNDICQIVKMCVCNTMHTDVIWPTGVNIGIQPLIETKIKGCQFRVWIVGERDMSFSRILT